MIVGISADQFASTDLIQAGKKAGLMSDVISVDASRDPYDCLKNAMYERRWTGPKHSILEREFLNLRDEGKKIDHPVTGDGTATLDSPSKDIADAVAGSVYNCFLKSDGGKAVSAFQQYAAYLKAAQKTASVQEQLFSSIKKQNRKNLWR